MLLENSEDITFLANETSKVKILVYVNALGWKAFEKHKDVVIFEKRIVFNVKVKVKHLRKLFVILFGEPISEEDYYSTSIQ